MLYPQNPAPSIWNCRGLYAELGVEVAEEDAAAGERGGVLVGAVVVLAAAFVMVLDAVLDDDAVPDDADVAAAAVLVAMLECASTADAGALDVAAAGAGASSATVEEAAASGADSPPAEGDATTASGVLVVNSTPASAAFCRSWASSNFKISSRFTSTGGIAIAVGASAGAAGGGRSSSVELRHHANAPMAPAKSAPMTAQRIITPYCSKERASPRRGLLPGPPFWCTLVY